MKVEVDKISDEIIQEIDETQNEFQRLSKESNNVKERIEELKHELEEIIKQLDSFEFDDQKYDDIITKLEVNLKPKFKSLAHDYKSSFLGYNSYDFTFDELSISDMFGSYHANFEVRIFAC